MVSRVVLVVVAACTAFAVAVGAAAATSDPATAVRLDAARLATAVQSAHAALLPDLRRLRADIARRDGAAVRRDVVQLRAHLEHVFPAVQSSRKQLLQDIEAAKAAGVDVSAALGASGPLASLRALQKQLKAGMDASRSPSLKVTKAKHVHTPAPKPVKTRHVHAAQHVHTPKPPFVKHPVQKHPRTGKHPHPHKPKKQ